MSKGRTSVHAVADGSDPKVGQLEAPSMDEHVGRLEVAVEDAT